LGLFQINALLVERTLTSSSMGNVDANLDFIWMEVLIANHAILLVQHAALLVQTPALAVLQTLLSTLDLVSVLKSFSDLLRILAVLATVVVEHAQPPLILVAPVVKSELL
jgi:hypothetical protein